jgi:Fe-S cluster biogenesis protein NfuA
MGDPASLVTRVEALTADLDPAAEELAGALMDLYGEGLERIMAAVDEETGRRLGEDGVIASLLLMHGLYPVPLEERVREALESVRPYMESHGGAVELVSLEDGVARIRLEGHCRGCSASASTLELGIRQALEASAPDLEGLVVDGVLEEPTHGPPPGAVLLPMAGGATPAPRAGGGGVTAPAAHTDEQTCELCPIGISGEHKHLIHLEERRIVCVCATCWALRSGDAEFRPVGNRRVWLDDLRITPEQWAAFQIPIGLAFFMISSVTGTVIALYPSPAGATESELDLRAWSSVCAANPELQLEPDSEALVVNRLADPPQHMIVPIDAAYGLVGVVKSSWEGITGGAGVAGAVADYLEELRARPAVGA